MTVQFKFRPEKAQAVAAFFASQGIDDLDRYKLLKLIFLADKFHLVQYGRPITGDFYVAMKSGPVPSNTYDILKLKRPDSEDFLRIFDVDRSYQFERYRLKAKAAVDTEVLSESDFAALEVTFQRYGKKTGIELWRIAHDMPEYEHAWEKRGEAQSILMNFEDFFEYDADALEGVRDEMLEEALLTEFLESPIRNADRSENS